ncbi:hypothetical protein FB45DRAFT_980453 [Roridomyces roridus]|uniref:Glycosyl transferase CAP10 domain-containing protein n=1 Tax=Roridomyces roridus TaxID=1738132 RepID=A0AAD7BKE6_9AGAR|nr:hypothetical protein FB45DRAFT_980453 [Roridomyces roridus]
MDSKQSRRTRAWVNRQGGLVFVAAVFFVFEHPIPNLLTAAATRFRTKVARQSTSLSSAVAEYRRRHHRAPPAGFDRWYKFASTHNFALVDEFDTVVRDLEPFWQLSGEELRSRADAAARLPGIDVVRIRGGQARPITLGPDGREVEGGGGARAQGLVSMMENFVLELPDMDLPVNARSEGRVIVPWEHTKYPNLTGNVPDLLSPRQSNDWGGSGSVWEAWRRTCLPDAAARRFYSSLGAGWSGGRGSGPRDLLRERYELMHAQEPLQTPGGGEGGELVFSESTNAELDFCMQPGAHYEQGHFFSDFRTLSVLAPVFSPSRPRGFSDIRIPSHYYYGGTRRYTYGWDPVNLEQHVVDKMEVPWEQKRDALWWRGASTGGGNSPPGFGAGYHRHRFVRMASVGLVQGILADAQRTTSVTFAVPPQPAADGEAVSVTTGGAYTTVSVPVRELNVDMMDTAFVKEVVSLGAEHRRGNSVELGVGWGYKYLLDLDGTGYSGRFMAFLASDSVPVKATVYDEYFSDWIEPWVHYIPLSASYAEIYNIISYFSGPSPAALRYANLSAIAAPYIPAGPEEADRQLRRIARAGKQWKRTMGRTIDMEVYVYRLVLEYARLWADDRTSMSYKS